MAAETNQIQIFGPLWSATARILKTETADGNLALRTLFVANRPRKLGSDWFYVPGTVLALCAVSKVAIHLGKRDYEWTIAGNQPMPATPEALQKALHEGKLALLVLSTDPAQAPGRQTYSCVAGEIGVPEGGQEVQLYHDLGITPAPGSLPDERLPGIIVVHGSGVWLPGSTKLPWHSDEVAAVFQLGPEPKLTIAHDLLNQAERAALGKAWRGLGACLNPLNPLYATSEGKAPTWVTLDLADPNTLPHLTWAVTLPAAANVPPERGDPALDPTEVNLILSDRHPNDQKPPTTVAQVMLQRIVVTKNEARWQIEAATAIQPQEARVRLTYQMTEEGETFVLSPVAGQEAPIFAFDPVEVPRWIRGQQGLPTPVIRDRPDDTPAGLLAPVRTAPILWGCVPLVDGWVQAPIPNLTEQIYLDADPTLGSKIEEVLKARISSVNSAPRSLRGAVAFGNRGDLPAGPGEDMRGEQPWSIIITDVASAAGTWSYDPATKQIAVKLDILDAQVTLDGFFWLAAGRPSAEDALPDLTDWLTGLRSVPLQLISTNSHLYSPVASLELGDSLIFSLRPDAEAGLHATLDTWSLIYRLDASQHEKLTGQTAAPAPLVWLRHPTMPMIQTLPLTQNRWPPNHPSASRQLTPFIPKATQDGWSLTLETRAAAGATAADAWPRVASGLETVRAWGGRHDLGLAALSLPGLLLDPEPEADAGSVTELPRRYRHDLPYTDELNALARVPVRPKPGAGDGSDENAENLDESIPLTPETFAMHWDQLSRRASLAALDAVDALEGNSNAAEVKYLLEPYSWPAQVTWDLDTYPGELVLTQDGQAMELKGEKALQGMSGAFAIKNDALEILFAPTDDAMQIDAGSMAAHLNRPGAAEPEGMRDQRGLVRQHTTRADKFITTPLAFVREPGTVEKYLLTSSMEPVELAIGASPAWNLWFRDLPLVEGASEAEPLTFLRDDWRSTQNQDVNDPEALGRNENFRQGYEWRLSAGPDKPLTLKGLHFFPLTLQEVRYRPNALERVVLTGRLQLPLPGGQELEGLANTVKLTFVGTPSGLALGGLEPAITAPGQSPLTVKDGAAGSAPRLEWGGVSYGPIADRVIMTDVRLHFTLLDKAWVLAFEGDLRFPMLDSPDSIGFRMPPSDMKPALGLNEVEVTLDLKDGNHRAVAKLDVSFGSVERGRPILTAVLDVDLLTVDPLSKTSPVIPSVIKFMDEAVTFSTQPGQGQADAARAHVTLTAESLALSWLGYAQGTELQLLPGMDVLTEAYSDTGYAIFSFTLEPAGAAVAGARAWQFAPKSGFVEALLNCRWGKPLIDAETPQLEGIFAPSAGNLTGAYTASWLNANQWNETLLLNGILEVRNLISWPKPVSADPLRLPASPPGADLSHVRHTMRVLLNQHAIPGTLLRAGAGPLLFYLGSTAPADESTQPDAWEFLAVIEHQLAAITQGGTLIGDRRWTVTQEVRLLPRPSFGWYLDALGGWQAKDPTTGIGYFGPVLRKSLKDALDDLPDGMPVLFVEASAHFWIAPQKIAGDPTPQTSLQFLPGGATLAMLSSPEDYQPAASPSTGGPEWILLTLPFLGRLSSKRVADAEFNPLLDDAIELLQRNNAPDAARATAAAMANRGVQQPVTVRSNALDGWAGHCWPRLDAASLEESWLRLHDTRRETPAREIQSVLAAFPDSPARLSRDALMKRLYEPKRKLGAAISASGEGPVPAESAATPIASMDVQVVPVALDNAEFTIEANKRRHPFHRPGQDNHPFGDNDAVPSGWQVFEAGYRNEILTTATPDWRARFDALKVRGGRWGLPRFRFPMEQGDVREAKTYSQLYNTPAGNRSWLIYADSAPIHAAIGQEVMLKKGEYVLTCWIVPVQSGDGGIPNPLDNPTPLQLELLRTEYRARWRPPAGDSRVSLWFDGVAQSTRDGGLVRYHQWNKVQWRFTVTATGLVKLGILLEGTGNWLRNGWLIDNFSLVQLVPDVKPPPKTIDHPVWRPDNLLALASGAAVEPSVPGWHALAPRLMASQLWPFTDNQDDQGPVSRFAAAILLPTKPEKEMLPVGLAVSPYLGLGFQPAPPGAPDYLFSLSLDLVDELNALQLSDGLRNLFVSHDHPLSPEALLQKVGPTEGNWTIVDASREYRIREENQKLNVYLPNLQVLVAELLCQERQGFNRNLAVVQTRVWDWTNAADKSISAATDVVVRWAKELHARLYTSSPFAVLRLRLIHGNPAGAAQNRASVVTAYGFHLVSDLEWPVPLLRQMTPLRAQAEQLRFREGQFGGYSIPDKPQPFELAPPQVTGVQPIYLPDGSLFGWPWGLSALRIRVHYTRAQGDETAASSAVGVLEDNSSVWWQAPQLHVQFRSATNGQGPAAGLPKSFRASAIHSLLPVVPKPEMPKAIEMGVAPPEGTPDSLRLLYRWQPVLPGGLRFLVLGARAGAMLALRHQLLRQSLKETGEHLDVMVSGSIPVQHRVPRPVPLPANRDDDQAHALQTWASYFEPKSNALVTSAPADEAFFAPAGLIFIINEATLQAVKAADPSLNLDSLNGLDVLNRPIAGLDALLGTLQDKLGESEGTKALPLFARIAERSYGAGIVEFRCTAQTRASFKTAGFDPDASPYDRFSWNAIADEPYTRFNQFATEFQLLETLKQLEDEQLLNTVQAGAFAQTVFGLTRRRFGTGRVKLAISEPARGEIGRDWDGGLHFEVKPERESDIPELEPSKHWQLEVSAELGDRRLTWRREELPEAGRFELEKVEVDHSVAAADAESPLQVLNNWLAGRSTGDILLLEARIKPIGGADDFAQVLRFPLRFVEKDVLPLPLAPAFVHFEDPEYNRLLATPAAHASVMVTETHQATPSIQEAHTATLAADRRRYNPDSTLHVRYDWDDERRGTNAILSLYRISGEVMEPLRWEGTADGHTVSPGTLTRIPLASLRLSKTADSAAEAEPFPGVDWFQGDVLQLKLVLDGFKDSPILLRVAIVQAQVDPAPEAGYAILRQQSFNGRPEVECVRFAFGPRPARIDLVSADDLRVEIVRRRAVFQWIDVARPGTAATYTVQKIAANGSTHIPTAIPPRLSG